MSKAIEVKALTVKPKKTWQVLCGDTSHWRAGVYSPPTSSFDEIHELEKHSCGELTLVIEEKPVFINAWHNGYCPKGPYTGKAFVVERDEFITKYKSVKKLTY